MSKISITNMKTLRNVAATVVTTDFLDAREYLSAVYEALKRMIPQYSYLRFTEDLGFGRCNALYLIVKGNRPLTQKGARKICEALNLTGLDRRYFLQLVSAQCLTNPTERDEAFDKLVALKSRALPRALDRQQLEFYNQWYNAAILELLSLPDASDEAAWIASRLVPAITPLTATKSLKLLKKLGHLVFDEKKKRLVPSQAVLSTGSEVIGLAVIRYHQQMIGLARDALTDIEPMERDISAVTIAVPAKRIGEIKDRIQAFRRELLDLSKNCDDADEILQINVQLFPIARGTQGRKRHEK